MKTSSYRVTYHKNNTEVQTFFISESYSVAELNRPFKPEGWIVHHHSSGRCAKPDWFFRTFEKKLEEKRSLPQTSSEALSWLNEYAESHKLTRIGDQ